MNAGSAPRALELPLLLTALALLPVLTQRDAAILLYATSRRVPQSRAP